MGLIPERLLEQMTPDEQETARRFIQGIKTRSSQLQCPHCLGIMQVEIGVDLRAVDVPTPKAKYVPPPDLDRVPRHYRQMIEASKASGLFDQFAGALKEEKLAQVPRDIDVFFCRFWDLSAPVHLTARQRDLVQTHYGQGAVAWGANGVLMILRQGLVVAFVPQRFLRAAVGHGKFQMSVVPQFEQWVKGPFGYVPADARGFAAELSRQNIGKFGVLVQ